MGTDGLPVLLKGVIWSGFENGTMVNGLQVGTAYLMCSSPRTVATHLHMSGLNFSVQGESQLQKLHTCTCRI